MSSLFAPSRAILNFTHHCAMSCEWCYVPFNSLPAQKQKVFAIVERIASLGFKNITIGGGDPFQYKFLPELLLLAKSLHLFVHVDTHGKSLRESNANLEILEATVDLIGLPLDGSNSSVHDGMRNSTGHFELIQSRVRWLGSLANKLKFNTVISSQNAQDLPELAKLVALLKPARWSIYQYWPIGPGARALANHGIPDTEFLSACRLLSGAHLLGSTIIEVNPRESRRDTYPIIHHDGDVFVHTQPPINQFVPLGNIFTENILTTIAGSCHSERAAAKSRYAKIIPINHA